MDATMALINPCISLPMAVVRIVRIWDTVGADQILKAQYKVLGGRVYVSHIL